MSEERCLNCDHKREIHCFSGECGYRTKGAKYNYICSCEQYVPPNPGSLEISLQESLEFGDKLK